MAGSSRHGATRRWWRTPVLCRLSRRTANLALAAAAGLAMVAGSAAGAAVQSVTDSPQVAHARLGPVRIHLPDDVGPWSTVPESSFDRVRGSDDVGGAVIDGAWGAMAPGAVVVTVLTADDGTHGGVASVRDSIPESDEVTWASGRDHAAGEVVDGGVRELMLAVECEGDLVILSVSGPEDAFDSGSLLEAFRTALVDE